MNSSHLGVIHVGKCIHTFSIWGGVDYGVQNWGGYRCRSAEMGGMGTHTQNWGGNSIPQYVFSIFP